MQVTGDYAKLTRFRSNLQKVSSRGWTGELASRLGETSLKLVADEFRGERDPYGNAWRELANKRARGAKARAKILRDTGRMAASVNFAADATGFRIMIPVTYAPVHQYGATIPARSNAHGQQLRGRYTKNGQFRFVKKSAKTALLVRAKAATFGEVTIPQRQILPMASTGGLGPIWLRAYNTTAVDLLKRKLQVAA